ncbi:MAG: GAF domain-containing protein [Verrucomicrobiota bacterium]
MSSVPVEAFRNHTSPPADRRLLRAMEIHRPGTWSLCPESLEIRLDERMMEILKGTPAAAALDFETAMAAVHPDDRETVRSQLTAALLADGTGGCSGSFRVFLPDGRVRWVTALGETEFSDGDGTRSALGLAGTARDSTDENQAEKLLIAQKDLLERIVRGESLDEILLAIVGVVEDQSSTRSVAAIMLLDRENQCLRNAASRQLPIAYLESVDGIRADADTGTCAAAAALNQPVFSPDLATDPRWEGLAHLPADLGLKAAWSTPVRGSDGGVLGTIGTYFPEARLPEEREIRIANIMAETAALVIEKMAATEKHRELIQETNHRKSLYEAAVANTPDLVYVFDLNHRFSYANPALLKMWGKTWEESAGKSCLELGYEPWHAEMHDREIEEVVRTRQSVKGEVPFQGPLGRRIYEYIFSPVLGEGGAVVAVSGTTRDVTDRKCEEERAVFLAGLTRRLAYLSNERELVQAAVGELGSFLNAHRCYFVECLAEENRILIGPNWLRDAGTADIEGELNLFDFGGREWWEKYSSGNFVVRDVRDDPLTREKAGNYQQVGILSYAVQPYKTDGAKTVVLGVTSETPRIWTAEELVLIESVMARTWPLVERARAEKALRESGERLRLLWESASILLTTDDPETMLQRLFAGISGHLGADSYFNFIMDEDGSAMSLSSHHGISEEEAAECARVMVGENACGLVALLQKPVVIPGIVLGEHRRSLDRFGLKAYAGYPLLKDGRVFGTLAFASRKREAFAPEELEFLETISHYVTAARIRLELLASLRRADRRKDEFLATLAHELRNPLAPIRTGVEVLKQVMDQPDKAAPIIGVIERQTAQMVRLIDDLIDVSRITRSKLELRSSDIDLGEVLAAATEAVHPLLTTRGHELSVSLPDSAVLVHGDASRLSQVFSNLLSNAARYTPEGGKIRLGIETAGDAVTVSIADNGDGIEPDMQHSIFEMFTQVKRAGYCPTDGGLGIGLTLVRLITEMHGGTVEVRSEGNGKGSEFRITLPRISREAETEILPATANKTASANRGRILVVDDGVSTADILAMFFNLEGFETRTAYNGASGLEIARDHRPDVAFIDIGMPEMDGNETARRLREIPGCESTILIALTGWGQEDDRRKTQEAGFNHHLVKPAAPAMLREMLAQLDL